MGILAAMECKSLNLLKQNVGFTDYHLTTIVRGQGCQTQMC